MVIPAKDEFDGLVGDDSDLRMNEWGSRPTERGATTSRRVTLFYERKEGKGRMERISKIKSKSEVKGIELRTR